MVTMADTVSAQRARKREKDAPPLSAAVKRQNLRWQINMAKAKAGLFSSMAVPKKVSQKMKGRLKKMGGDKLPEIRKQAHEHLDALQIQFAQRQRHHRVKQVQQAVKKAKAFVLRKVVRKCKEAAASASFSTPSELELRLLALKKLPVALASHKALLKYGLADREFGEPVPAAWEEMVSAHPSVCALVEAQLLQHPQVKAQLEKLADDVPLTHDAAAAPAAATLSTSTTQKAADKPAAKALKKTAYRDGGVEEGARNGECRGAMKGREGAYHGDTDPGAIGSEARSTSRARVKSGGVDLKTIVTKSASRGADAPRKRLRKRDFEQSVSGGASAGGSEATAPSSRFVDSLAADDDARGGFTLGGAADLDEDAPKKSAKRNNIISRSGNRMGQRQRQALAQRDSGEMLGRGGGRGSGRGAGRGGGRGTAAPGRQFRQPSAASGGKYLAGGKGAVKGGGEHTKAGASSAPTEKETLHPSWEAKRNSVAAIQEFQGKRITFD